MARARKASLTKSKIATVLFGEPFTGKSTMAMQLAYFKHPDGTPFRVLYLDPESGSIDDYLQELEENGVDLNNIYIVYTQSVGEVREYIKKAKNNEDFYELDEDGDETNEVVLDADGKPFRPDAIVIDGTSILNMTTKQGLVEFSKKRAKIKADAAGLIGDEKLVKIEGAGLELKDYQTVNFRGQDLILDLMGCGKHFVVTARETDEKVTKEINGKDVTVSTGRKIPDGFKNIDYNVKTVIRMFRDEDERVKAKIVKDRTKVHEDCEVIDDPTLLDWQVVVDKSANRNDFVIQNNLTKAVEIEHEIFKKEMMGEGAKQETETKPVGEVDVLISNITEVLDKLSVVKKNEVKKKLTDNKIPKNYKEQTDIAILSKFLQIVKSC